jgi:hypothetical protein
MSNVIRVKRQEIQTLHCSKRFNFSNAYSAQDFIWTPDTNNSYHFAVTFLIYFGASTILNEL